MGRPTKITEQQKQTIVRLSASGQSVRAIGAEVGLSHTSVQRMLEASRAAVGATIRVAPRGRSGPRGTSSAAVLDALPPARPAPRAAPKPTPKPIDELARSVASTDARIPIGVVDELDDYDRRRWDLVRRIDEALCDDLRASDLAQLVKAQNTILATLQNSAAMRRATGDTTDGLADIAASTRARLRRLAEASRVAVPASVAAPATAIAAQPKAVDG